MEFEFIVQNKFTKNKTEFSIQVSFLYKFLTERFNFQGTLILYRQPGMPETLDLSQGITDSQLHTEQLANTSIVRITNAQQIIDKFASQNDFSSNSINTFCASLKETLGASLNDQFVQYNDDFQKWSKHIEKVSKKK